MRNERVATILKLNHVKEQKRKQEQASMYVGKYAQKDFFLIIHKQGSLV